MFLLVAAVVCHLVSYLLWQDSWFSGERGHWRGQEGINVQPYCHESAEWGVWLVAVSSIIRIELKCWEQWKYEIWSVNRFSNKYR
jgi:hypothetical protein